jgi:hypothetical protein
MYSDYHTFCKHFELRSWQTACFFYGSTALRGLGLVIVRRFTITLIDTPRSVGLVWTSDQLVAETSI